MSTDAFPCAVAIVGSYSTYPDAPHNREAWGRLYSEDAGLVFHEEPMWYNLYLPSGKVNLCIPWSGIKETRISSGFFSLFGAVDENVIVKFQDTTYDMVAMVSILPGVVLRMGGLGAFGRAKNLERAIWAERGTYIGAAKQSVQIKRPV